MRLIRLACALALAGVLGMPAMAQDWATLDLCTVTGPEIDPRVLPPDLLAELEQKATRFRNGTGRYWRIESPDGAVSHLWGTFHSTDPLILDLPQRVEDDIDAARLVALEIDYIWQDRQSYTNSHDFDGWFREGGSLIWRFQAENTGVPEPIIQRIRARTEGVGWSWNAPDLLTLGGLASLVMSDPCDDFSAGTLPIQDSRIQMLGMIAGADIVGLEPAGAFMAYLNAPQNRATALSLITVYGSYLAPEPGARQTQFALYLQGRLGLMMALDEHFVARELGADGLAHLERTDAYLLDERNVTFVENVLPELEQGSVFIGVGAFHLGGENGMVALLRDAGFTVTRVSLPGEAPAP